MHQHYKYSNYKSLLKPLLFWEEIEKNIIDTYTPPKHFIKQIEVNEIDELINKQIKNYNKMTKENLEETLKFLFNNYREFLYFRIRDNLIESYHIYNYDYKNDWAKDLKTFNNKEFKHFYFEYLKVLKRPFMKYDQLESWYTNNCILSMTDYSKKYGLPTSYISEILDMLEYTKNKFNGIPDCDLIINRKDFPLLTLDRTPSYSNIYSKSKNMNQPRNPWIICSQCKTLNHFDINFPTADEWKSFSEDTQMQTDWSKKYETAIWRGSSTGCGTNIKNNKRLNLANISHKWKTDNRYNSNNNIDKKPYLDVGITNFVKRLKVMNQTIYYLNPKDLNFYLSKRMEMKDQTYCKYIFNIEGNVAAYRYSTLFASNSVILNIKSKYYLWFEPLLKDKDFIEVKEDFDENYIADTITYLKKNDEYARNIASNGVAFYNKYINKNKISEYWYKLLTKVNFLQI